MKTFHIATDEDDIDSLVKPEAIKATSSAAVPAPQTVKAPAAAPQEITVNVAIEEANAAKTGEELTAVWKKWQAKFGKDVNFVKAIASHPANPKGGRTNK